MLHDGTVHSPNIYSEDAARGHGLYDAGKPPDDLRCHGVLGLVSECMST